MAFASRSISQIHWQTSGCCLAVLIAALIFPRTSQALPARLVLGLDGVAYRDMKALQTGVTYTNSWGRLVHRQAFTAAEGYFPVSRMVSTFPSTSDVAWTDIFGDRPLPGYQRTYFSQAANSEIVLNGVSTTSEHESQMQWETEDSFIRSMGYFHPVRVFNGEIRGFIDGFWKAENDITNYYVYVRSSDDAQHMNCDIFSMLCTLDEQLQDLRARYTKITGHDLQIVMVSDHGHNHAGRGRRVEVNVFLEKAGYHLAKSISGPNDVVLPTAGIETWVEIHNSPPETEKLAERLTHLAGVDILAAVIPERTNAFVVMDSKGNRAVIDWNRAANTFRYQTDTGDPLKYNPVIDALRQKNRLDADGFATADDWMSATFTNHYPLALERIARGLTRAALNPATILISLDNHYVNASWLIDRGSKLVACTSTHGALDDINSDGIFMTNYKPTQDTSSARVAGQADDFSGLRHYRADQDGAEWVTGPEQGLTRIARVPFDKNCAYLPQDEVFLRIWSPQFTRVDANAPVKVTIESSRSVTVAPIRRADRRPAADAGPCFTLDAQVSLPVDPDNERIYACPAGLALQPRTGYRITGSLQNHGETSEVFDFNFYTDSRGRPAAY